MSTTGQSPRTLSETRVVRATLTPRPTRSPHHAAARRSNTLLHAPRPTQSLCAVCGQELQTALHLAARQGDADGVELLLERGAAPNTVTADLNTPLHGAAREGHDHVVRLLIDHGANMELANKVRATDALRDASMFLFISLFKHQRQRAQATYMPVKSSTVSRPLD